MLKITINLKSTFYEDKEMSNILLEFYLNQRIDEVVYKKAYDISGKGSHILPKKKIKNNEFIAELSYTKYLYNL